MELIAIKSTFKRYNLQFAVSIIYAIAEPPFWEGMFDTSIILYNNSLNIQYAFYLVKYVLPLYVSWLSNPPHDLSLYNAAITQKPLISGIFFPYNRANQKIEMRCFLSVTFIRICKTVSIWNYGTFGWLSPE